MTCDIVISNDIAKGYVSVRNLNVGKDCSG